MPLGVCLSRCRTRNGDFPIKSTTTPVLAQPNPNYAINYDPSFLFFASPLQNLVDVVVVSTERELPTRHSPNASIQNRLALTTTAGPPPRTENTIFHCQKLSSPFLGIRLDVFRGKNARKHAHLPDQIVRHQQSRRPGRRR